MIRTARDPRIRIEHPREPEASHAYLWAILDGKREDTVRIEMTEAQLYDLAEQALVVAGVLRFKGVALENVRAHRGVRG